mgnify:CR=1 FL=1
MGILFASVWDNLLENWWAGCFVLALLIVLAGIFRHAFFVRIPLWVLMHTVYRVRSHGMENIPETGAALLVCNHVSYLDPLIILAGQKRRVRFLMWAPYTKLPLLRWIVWLARVIPIQGNTGPRAIIQALRMASEALAEGEGVCIFAEGGVTRTGFLLPFQRGF